MIKGRKQNQRGQCKHKAKWNERKRKMKCLSPKGKTKQTCWMDGKCDERWTMSAQQVYDVIEGGIFYGTLDWGKTEQSTVALLLVLWFHVFFFSNFLLMLLHRKLVPLLLVVLVLLSRFLRLLWARASVLSSFSFHCDMKWRDRSKPLTKKKLWMKMWIRVGQYVCNKENKIYQEYE